MPTVLPNRNEAVTLQPGEILTVTAPADVTSSGLVRHVGSSHGVQRIGFNSVAVANGQTRIVGPFGTPQRFSISCTDGQLTYTQGPPDTLVAAHQGKVEAFTGSRTLTLEDAGKLLRCDDASAVTITVPNFLPEGFNVGVSMWGAGTVTVAAASGALKRSTTSILSTQYNNGSICVMKNADGASAEFVLGGDFA